MLAIQDRQGNAIRNDLFECILQGVFRELRRVFWNAAQQELGESEFGCNCSEWWPSSLPDVTIPGFRLTVEKGFDSWVTIESAGIRFSVEMSSKRIGMYGPHSESRTFSETEWIEWFKQTMDLLRAFDQSELDRRNFGWHIIAEIA